MSRTISFRIDEVVHNYNLIIPEMKSPFLKTPPAPVNEEFFLMHQLDLEDKIDEFNAKISHHQKQANNLLSHMFLQNQLNMKLYDYSKPTIDALHLTHRYNTEKFLQSFYTISRFPRNVLISNDYQGVKFYKFCENIEYLGEGEMIRAERHKSSEGATSGNQIDFKDYMYENGPTNFRSCISHHTMCSLVSQIREFASLLVINPANKVNLDRGSIIIPGQYNGNLCSDIISLGIITLYENYTVFNSQLPGSPLIFHSKLNIVNNFSFFIQSVQNH